MATNFPAGLDSLTNPTSSNTLSSPDHAGQHADANDAIEALQAKVGVDGSAVGTTLDYKVAASKTVTDKIDPAGASTNQVLKFNGTKFVPATGASVTISDTPPTSPTPQAGDQWYESDTGRTLIYYDGAWVETGSVATTNVNANDLSGTTLASGVVNSSLTAVTSTALTHRQASTQDGVAIQGRAGGTGTYEVTLTPTTLTADRTLTLPDKTGTVATIADTGMVLVYEGALGSATNHIDSCFSDSYANYLVLINITAASASTQVRMQLRTGTTTNTSSNYVYGGFNSYSGSNILNATNSGGTTTYFYLGDANASFYPNMPLRVEVMQPKLAYRTTIFASGFIPVDPFPYYRQIGGAMSVTTAYESFTLSTDNVSTTISGTVRVYGYRSA